MYWILITVFLLNPFAGIRQISIKCSDLKCVHEAVNKASASKYTQRIRVFGKNNEPVILNETIGTHFKPDYEFWKS